MWFGGSIYGSLIGFDSDLSDDGAVFEIQDISELLNDWIEIQVEHILST